MAANPIYFSEEKSEEAVLSRMDPKKVDPRLHEIMTSLVKHLHAFIKEVEPTNEEWMEGIQFLTKTGHMCTDWRQEFILLSDVLGVSMLVDAVNHRDREGATETTVLGPFYVGEHKVTPHGTDISANLTGERMFVQSRVTDIKGKPLANVPV